MGLEEIRKLKAESGKPKPPKQYSIPKKSSKRIAKEAAEKEARGDNDTELVLFFKRCIKRFTGYCLETGLKTETRIFQYAVMSVAHILPKASCKSVMYHPCNWLELNVDFHHKFDSMSWEEREKLGCWPIIQERLIMVYPDLDPTERRFFPPSVLAYMEKHSAF